LTSGTILKQSCKQKNIFARSQKDAGDKPLEPTEERSLLPTALVGDHLYGGPEEPHPGVGQRLVQSVLEKDKMRLYHYNSGPCVIWSLGRHRISHFFLKHWEIDGKKNGHRLVEINKRELIIR